jgi:hypothetical protein
MFPKDDTISLPSKFVDEVSQGYLKSTLKISRFNDKIV